MPNESGQLDQNAPPSNTFSGWIASIFGGRTTQVAPTTGYGIGTISAPVTDSSQRLFTVPKVVTLPRTPAQLAAAHRLHLLAVAHRAHLATVAARKPTTKVTSTRPAPVSTPVSHTKVAGTTSAGTANSNLPAGSLGLGEIAVIAGGVFLLFVLVARRKKR